MENGLDQPINFRGVGFVLIAARDGAVAPIIGAAAIEAALAGFRLILSLIGVGASILPQSLARGILTRLTKPPAPGQVHSLERRVNRVAKFMHGSAFTTRTARGQAP
jgi:hypothetical protein